MPNKTTYKDEQRAAREAIAPKHFSKGERIEYVTREGKSALFPNSRGQNVRLVNGKLQFLNRKQSRQRAINRTMTKRNYMNGVRIGSFAYSIIHAIAKRQDWDGESSVSSYRPTPRPPINKKSKSRIHRERQRSYARFGVTNV